MNAPAAPPALQSELESLRRQTRDLAERNTRLLAMYLKNKRKLEVVTQENTIYAEQLTHVGRGDSSASLAGWVHAATGRFTPASQPPPPGEDGWKAVYGDVCDSERLRMLRAAVLALCHVWGVRSGSFEERVRNLLARRPAES